MWARGEPRVDPRRACVAMDIRTGYWKTANCIEKKNYVCKIALGKKSPARLILHAPVFVF